MLLIIFTAYKYKCYSIIKFIYNRTIIADYKLSKQLIPLLGNIDLLDQYIYSCIAAGFESFLKEDPKTLSDMSSKHLIGIMSKIKPAPKY